jgi:hypothetical protein
VKLMAERCLQVAFFFFFFFFFFFLFMLNANENTFLVLFHVMLDLYVGESRC